MMKTSFTALLLLAGASAMTAHQDSGDYPKPYEGGLAQVSIQQAGVKERSITYNQPVHVAFKNTSNQAIELFWHNYQGIKVSYGTIAAGATMQMNTYASHPWSATGVANAGALLAVDGEEVFVPEAADAGRTIIINVDNERWQCDHTVNFITSGPSYSQISLTDGCSNNVCDANPKYGAPNNNERAMDYCQQECDQRQASGTACEGFFYQKHMNGHEICGFYASGMDNGVQGWHGHQAGAICQRGYDYELVGSGDCSTASLVNTVEECAQAIEDVFGVTDAVVQTWNTSAYAKGCFKHNYGHPGSSAAAAAPTVWVFNQNGGPGTSGHCTAEPGYAACICRDLD